MEERLFFPLLFLVACVLSGGTVCATAQTNAGPANPVVMPPDTTMAPTATNLPPDAVPDAVTNVPTDVAPAAASNVPAATAPVSTSDPSTNSLSTPNALMPPAANSPAAGVTPGGNPQEDIQDIRPPLYFLRSWSWLWIALGVLAAVALLTFLWRVFKPNRLLSARSAYELTLDKLEQARAMLREDNSMAYAIFVSEIIRSYLGQRFETPSTRRTTDEFLRLMENDPNTPLAEHRDLLREFLRSCDLVKFAKYQPTLAELETVQQRACTFVTATKPVAGPPSGRPS